MSFSDPEKNIRQLELEPGMTVADFGAGSGFYTINAAQEVGREGKVYAVDVQKELLSRIQQTARAQELSNVELAWGDLEKPGGSTLRDSSVDAVILSNILFQVEDQEVVLDEVKRVLKSGGRVLVIDWSDSFGGLGPQEKDIIPEHEVRKMFEDRGFNMGRSILAGAHHYGFVAFKQ